MAKKTVYLDDLEPNDVEADAGTVTFSLEGTRYEIDLSTKNATRLRSALAPFMEAGRKLNGSPTVAKVRSSSAKLVGGSGYSSDQLNAIRTWARANGFEVSDKGRIAGNILAAFEDAQTKRPGKQTADQLFTEPAAAAAE